MITLDNVTKSFGDKTILDAVSLTIHEGDHVAVGGVSGCGKTTLLRLIAGLDAPDQGEVRIAGELASSASKIVLPPHRRQVGFVFQSSALWPHMNVAQNILFGLGSLPKLDCTKSLSEILSSTGTTHLASRMPDTLSGGERRRVAIARTLAPKPKILLMDEPLTNLDSTAQAELGTLIREIVERTAMTLVYVTHNREEAALFCDKHYVLKDSKLKKAPVIDRKKST